MRVALVIERFRPGGGVENVAWTVAHRLAAAGDAVSVVASDAAAQARVPVERVRVPSAWQPLRVLAFSRAAARATRTGFDVVHSFSRTRHQNLYRAGGGCHAAYLERAHRPFAARMRRLSPRHVVLLAMEAAIFGDPDQLVVCNSALVRDQITERYRVPAERLAVLPNGVDLERFHPDRRKEGRLLREELGTGTGPVWLFAGSGFERKGLETALAGLARAAGELWVAGRDDAAPWRARAARLGVGERVRFLGERDDLERVYAAADALVLPTRYDAFANVCLEAAASGLPVATSAANGAAAALGGGAIVVAEAADVDGFVGALDELADPERRRTLGSAARRAAQALGWDAHVAALRELYRRVAR